MTYIIYCQTPVVSLCRAVAGILYELTHCVRRGSAGISPQSAAVYADATCDPTESKLAANNSPADPSEQSTTTAGQWSCVCHWQHNSANIVLTDNMYLTAGLREVQPCWDCIYSVVQKWDFLPAGATHLPR